MLQVPLVSIARFSNVHSPWSTPYFSLTHKSNQILSNVKSLAKGS